MSDNGLVVVGIDGSKSALDAARWAAAMATRFGGSLHLVLVMRAVDETLLAVSAAEQEDAGAYPRELGQATLDRVADAVQVDFPRLPISRTLSHRPVEEAFNDLSRRARMVVLACAKVSPTGALVVGSTTLAVASHSACPVVAWRGDAVVRTSAPIAVGVDGEDTSHAALVAAFGLADRLGVPVTVVHAIPEQRPPGEISIPLLIDYKALENLALQRLSRIVAPVSDWWPAVDVHCAVGTGPASRVILQHAVGAQLVVVGHRGRGNLASALLGSTGLGLLHHSPAPVMMCPASYEWGALPIAAHEPAVRTGAGERPGQVTAK